MKTIKHILSMMAVTLGLVLPLAVSSSRAQQVISYQGLATSNGVNLSGSHTLVLAIYANPTGGTALWSETQSDVTFTDGIFNVLIGSDTPLPIFDAGSYTGKPRAAADYYLGVSIDGGAELTPRSQLGAAPTAWSARFADSARVASNATNAWSFTGNTGTIYPSNFIGTTVTASGYNALFTNTIGTSNTAMGRSLVRRKGRSSICLARRLRGFTQAS
jgi:hypothetical protein